MKIIAIIPSGHYGAEYDRVLVEMDKGELSKISCRQLDQYSTPKPGTQFDVHDAWGDLQLFRDAKKRITSAAETLRACAQLSETAAAAYVAEPEEEPATPSPVQPPC